MGPTGALVLLLAALGTGQDRAIRSRLPITTAAADGCGRYSWRWVGGQVKRPGDYC